MGKPIIVQSLYRGYSTVPCYPAVQLHSLMANFLVLPLIKQSCFLHTLLDSFSNNIFKNASLRAEITFEAMANVRKGIFLTSFFFLEKFFSPIGKRVSTYFKGFHVAFGTQLPLLYVIAKRVSKLRDWKEGSCQGKECERFLNGSKKFYTPLVQHISCKYNSKSERNINAIGIFHSDLNNSNFNCSKCDLFKCRIPCTLF